MRCEWLLDVCAARDGMLPRPTVPSPARQLFGVASVKLPGPVQEKHALGGARFLEQRGERVRALGVGRNTEWRTPSRKACHDEKPSQASNG
ncbi:hypothetical protein IF1G_01895 [Cordyceps javanica]|uniref:Uncharacterized protein n=1 Tax=Cordyceps javanica TaxID=43265 RepID=A0A545VD87_9HYPO|nr:hypothetical protein IF1G_01895 [Cordyceps javanica]